MVLHNIARTLLSVFLQFYSMGVIEFEHTSASALIVSDSMGSSTPLILKGDLSESEAELYVPCCVPTASVMC